MIAGQPGSSPGFSIGLAFAVADISVPIWEIPPWPAQTPIPDSASFLVVFST